VGDQGHEKERVEDEKRAMEAQPATSEPS